MVTLTGAERDSLTECECGHFANEHSSYGCLASSHDRDDGLASDGDGVCVCFDSPSAINRHAVETIIADRTAAAVRAERDRLLTRIEALADSLSRFDYLEAPDDVPLVVDVPDDYELGIHHAATLLRALLAEERAR